MDNQYVILTEVPENLQDILEHSTNSIFLIFPEDTTTSYETLEDIQQDEENCVFPENPTQSTYINGVATQINGEKRLGTYQKSLNPENLLNNTLEIGRLRNGRKLVGKITKIDLKTNNSRRRNAMRHSHCSNIIVCKSGMEFTPDIKLKCEKILENCIQLIENHHTPLFIKYVLRELSILHRTNLIKRTTALIEVCKDGNWSFKPIIGHVSMSVALTVIETPAHRSVRVTVPLTGVSFELCPFCFVPFDQQMAFYTHIVQIHESDTNTCYKCGEKFGSPCLLRKHHLSTMYTECGEKSALYTCFKHDQPLEFGNAHAFQRHKHRAHTHHTNVSQSSGGGRYQCDVCMKSFTRQSNLQRHQTVHEQNTYSCAICNCSYKFETSLTRHMLHNHIDAEDFRLINK